MRPVAAVVSGAIFTAIIVLAGLIAYTMKTGNPRDVPCSKDVVRKDFEEPPAQNSTESELLSRKSGPEWELFRLSPNVYPLHYRLHLHPDPEHGTFTG